MVPYVGHLFPYHLFLPPLVSLKIHSRQSIQEDLDMIQYIATHNWYFIYSLVKKSVYTYVKVPAHCASSRGLNRSPFSISSLLATIRLCRTSMAVSPFKKTERWCSGHCRPRIEHSFVPLSKKPLLLNRFKHTNTEGSLKWHRFL